jgi:hypothetical protein
VLLDLAYPRERPHRKLTEALRAIDVEKRAPLAATYAAAVLTVLMQGGSLGWVARGSCLT